MPKLSKNKKVVKEFNVGDAVWWATCGSSHSSIKCPVCFGKLKVVVILGNDEHIETPCDYCGRAFEGAQGFVYEYKWTSAVKQIVLESKNVSEGIGGRKIEYRSNHYVLDETCIFETKEEAEIRVVEMIAEHEIEEADSIRKGKEHDSKSYSWHVGYHQRCIKKAKKDLEYHEKKVVACKLLAKSPTTFNTK